MGHGTHHTAMVSYSQMQTQMDELGYDNVFVGTVEGDENFACDAIIERVAEAGYTKVVHVRYQNGYLCLYRYDWFR